MRNHASAAPAFVPPAPPRAASTSWTERMLLRVMGLPTDEQIQERLRNHRGLFARLTPEQREAMYAYDGPDVLGPANGPRRTF